MTRTYQPSDRIRHIIAGPAKGLRQPGYFRKRKPLDCGRPRCQVCHFTKVHGIPTIRDFRERARRRDATEEVAVGGPRMLEC